MSYINKPSRRRPVLKTLAGLLGTGTVFSTTVSAESNVGIEVTGVIESFDGVPVENARIWSRRVDPDSPSPYVRTDSEGEFNTTVPKGRPFRLGFYKSDEDDFHAKELDGVPHIYNLGRFDASNDDVDLGNITLPEAHKLDIRAVFAEKGGVEDADIGFAAGDESSYFGNDPYATTTTSDGFLKLIDADFIGIEMAGDVKVVVRPPDHPMYVEDEVEIYQEIAKDTTLEVDLSRRKPSRGR